MRGIANACDMNMLQLGMSCVIETTPSQEVWWGEVVSVEVNSQVPNSLDIVAKVTGGRFALDKFREPVKTPADNDKADLWMFFVYPDTATTRMLIDAKYEARNIASKAIDQLDTFFSAGFNKITRLIKDLGGKE